MQKAGFVYIMTTVSNNVLYIGVTSNLPQRVWQHRTKYYPNCFTARYNCIKLVYYYRFDAIGEAIVGEKRLKKRSREFKLALIKNRNPDRRDLWEEINDCATRNSRCETRPHPSYRQDRLSFLVPRHQDDLRECRLKGSSQAMYASKTRSFRGGTT